MMNTDLWTRGWIQTLENLWYEGKITDEELVDCFLILNLKLKGITDGIL